MTLQGCEFRPLRVLGSDTGARDLCSVNARQVALNAVEGCGKGAAESRAVFESPDTVAMPYWTISDQVQEILTEVTAGVDLTADVAPCTPLQALSRQKPLIQKASECSRSLPSLSLRIGSSQGDKEPVTNVLNQTSQIALANSMPKSQQFSLRQSPARSAQFVNSTPCKGLDRIQQEVHRKGPEVHKENLLSLSLPKQEKRLQLNQKLDPALSLGQHTSHALPSRVLASLGVPKLSATELSTSQQPTIQPPALQSSQNADGAHHGSSILLGSSHLQLLQPAKPKMVFSSASVFSGYQDTPVDSGASGSQHFSSEPKKSLTLSSSVFGKGSEMKWVSQEVNLEVKAVPAFVDGRSLLEAHSEVSQQWTANGACTTSFLPMKQGSNQTLLECGKYMQLLPCAPDFLSQSQQIGSSVCGLRLDSCDSGNPVKRLKSLSSTSGSASGSSQEQGRPNGLSMNREARKPTRKKRSAVEQPKSTCYAVQAANAHWYGQQIQNSQMHGKLQEYVSIPKPCTEDTECNNLICLSQRDSTEKPGENVKTLQEEHIPSQLSPFYLKEQQPKNSPRLKSSMLVSTSNRATNPPDAASYFEKVFSNTMEEVNAQSVGLKLSTTPSHAQMPKALPIFAAGEPCLPFSLELSQKPPDAVAGKTPVNAGSSSDADWGKYLALSATPVGHKAEADTKNMPPFQQRFKKLQAFLKQCDESDQMDCLQALRTLSASARSSHAVELETRAIRLSLEEGKEMDRMTLLNVLGHVPDRNLYDAGATPHGPRLPAPGAASNVKQGS